MRLYIKLCSDNDIILPVSYTHALQAIIYRHLPEDKAEWLHNEGFKYEKRRFKLFSFSEILAKGSYDKKFKKLKFPKEVSIAITSPIGWILEKLATNLTQKGFINFCGTDLRIQPIDISDTPSFENGCADIKMLSPMEVHTTFYSRNDKKFTKHYNPFDDEFISLINENLKKKWEICFKEENFPSPIKIKPLFSYRDKDNFKRILKFRKGSELTIIEGWKGYYHIEGDPRVLNLAYEVGLGSRNSGGMGMWELKKQ
ncbi:MAG: CRISPR-associated endoribonuclease Cas6 [Candidatus Cloacimonadota bacterium]|nr:MAG: CRISPR-associated endoribonuclease Cas6 [Candidatus Cloacimonadota bacterium]PIE78339.1 MAG: CRISPR-associated endoribonuclease Cas6 [Candidatus Delongbacteria bacterium]